MTAILLPPDTRMCVPLIQFENVSIQRGSRVILRDVNLSIAQGEHVAILGPNGSGKSTLIKVISRELYPLLKTEPWSLRILGRDRWNLFDLRNHLGIVSNDWAGMCTRDYSGFEIVLSGFFGSVGIWPNHAVQPEMEQKAREVMNVLEIGHLMDRNTDEMSSGEARRILIARALVHTPQALVLDEPANSLDLRAQWELREILRKLSANAISLILVTHHLPDIIPEIERVVLIRQGRVFCDGPKEQVLRAETLSGLFGVEVEVIERRGYYHVL
jgi:iron complex transport system ATP-binding protein